MAKLIQDEIILPETKPETEWLRGRAVQKVSPKLKHGTIQIWLGAELQRWARGRGKVASEWRFRISPRGEVIRPLVPDLSYLSYDRMRGATEADWDTPLVAPNVAVEVRSLSNRRADLEDKIATLLRAGTHLVVVVDSDTRTLTAHDEHGKRMWSEGESFEHEALPGFSVSLADMFAEMELDQPG
ncbi:MAG TPA: Uma2 family endonuclease [Candidatus Elarobacter sp.]|jgi:Uma2 family endonuclease|nr:Uma2 family endonuclease [Candidatus Elarobacter sp.]